MMLQWPMSCTLHEPWGAPLNAVQTPRPFGSTEQSFEPPLKVEHWLFPPE